MKVQGGDIMKLLSEVVSLIGLPRQRIQDYEKEGLAIKPTIRNNNGYLLYSDREIERLWQIKFYKELGYKTRQIKDVFFNPHYDRTQVLKQQIEELERKREKIDVLIANAKSFLETNVSPIDIKFLMPDDIPYDTLLNICSATFNIGDIEGDFCNNLSEDDWESFLTYLFEISALYKAGAIITDNCIQDRIVLMKSNIPIEIQDSVLLFSSLTLSLLNDDDLSKILNNTFGIECTEFIIEAIKHYCSTNPYSEIDTILLDTLENIGNLGIQKYKFTSKPVQDEVEKLYLFGMKISNNNCDFAISFLQQIQKLFASKEYKQMIDKGAEKGLSWFISQSIDAYFLNKEK